MPVRHQNRLSNRNPVRHRQPRYGEREGAQMRSELSRLGNLITVKVDVTVWSLTDIARITRTTSGAPSVPVQMTALRRGLEQTSNAFRHIDEVVQDEDQYQIDEPRPSEHVVNSAKKLIKDLELAGVTSLPKTYVSVYYGELDITWKTERRLVRLAFRDHGRAHMYYQDDYQHSTRGSSAPVDDISAVVERLHWLNTAS